MLPDLHLMQIKDAFDVNLTNVNEDPAASDATFALAENSANDTVVGSVSASDPDAS